MSEIFIVIYMRKSHQQISIVAILKHQTEKRRILENNIRDIIFTIFFI